MDIFVSLPGAFITWMLFDPMEASFCHIVHNWGVMICVRQIRFTMELKKKEKS